MENIETVKTGFKEKFKKNPAWYLLLITLFSFFLLPEYVSPFVLFASYIVFKKQWTKEGRLAKVGNIGKLEMGFMTLMLISAIWSPAKLDTLGSAGLWWAVFLIQIMIFNLARTKERINKVLEVIVASAAVNGALGAIQFITFVLSFNYITPQWLKVTTPFYSSLDVAVYTAMPFKIGTKMWETRASGTFSNPNLLASFMLVAFPLGIYLFINAESKKSRNLSFAALCCISFGMASTETRAGCYIIIALWAALFVLFIKRHAVKMLCVSVPTLGSAAVALLIRYGKINIYPNRDFPPISPEEALESSARHFEIWKSLIDYLTHHIGAFIFGTGFGCQTTGDILLNDYALKKPHAHNFVIEMWVELGLIGVIFLGIIIVYAAGKLLEIKPDNPKTLSLTITVLASFAALLLFGLSDYIFNSPKQIILFTMLIGIIQAISYVYEKYEIQKPADVSRMAKETFTAIVKQ